MHRSFLRATFLSVSILSITAAHAESPRKVPLTEDVHGIKMQDEYRWMEDAANKDEMVKWVDSEGAATRAKLDAIPERAEFLKLLEETSSGLERVSSYQRAAGTEAYLRSNAKTTVPLLYVRTGGKEKLLLDPGAGGDKLATVNLFELSPDGAQIGVNVASGGAELTTIQIYDVATGAKVGAPVERVWGEFGLSFLPGGKIAYTQIAEAPEGGDAMQGMKAYLRPVDGGAAVEVMGGSTGGATVAAKEFPLISTSEASPFVMGVGGGARADQTFFIAPAADFAAGKPAWKQVATLDDKVQNMALRGNELFEQTTRSNGSGEIILHNMAPDGSISEGKAVFAGTENLIIASSVAAKDGVYVSGQTDGVGRIFYSKDGKSEFAEVKMPFEGDVYMSPNRSGNGISLGLSGWTTSTQYFTVENGALAETGIGSENWKGAADFTSERREAISADGTKVPLVILRSKKGIPEGGAPTLVEAYGGYGINTATPYYFRDGMSWLSKGGVFAFCGTRGGGERGRAWHEGGRGPNKPRGQEDLIACAETLTAKGIAPKQGPVAYGGSMAGALVPVAALRNPDAFAGMITAVGIVNATRIGAAENGANQFAEVGDPSNPKQFKDLLAMDAYQTLLAAKDIPDTMMTIGLTDRRVAPWMSAKFVARAHDRFPGKVILRSEKEAGHGVGTTETVRREQIADMWAFAWVEETKE